MEISPGNLSAAFREQDGGIEWESDPDRTLNGATTGGGSDRLPTTYRRIATERGRASPESEDT